MRTRRSRVSAPLSPEKNAHVVNNDDGDDSDDGSKEEEQTFSFNGQVFSTYSQMVQAKRERNRNLLVSSGLLEAKAAVDNAIRESKISSTQGIKRTKVPKTPLPRRKSSRLSGSSAPVIYVEAEMARGKVIVGGHLGSYEVEREEPEFYNGRVNDGSDLSVAEAVNLTGPKWTKEGTVESAERFTGFLSSIDEDLPLKSSPTSSAKDIYNVQNLKSCLDALSLDNIETDVAKVVPDRIYSVACHPHPDSLIVCAGDKKGYVGIWNVDKLGDIGGVHLFKPHSGAVSSLSWTSRGQSLLSSSYDGTVRLFDVERQSFKEIFATYSDDDMYKDKLGYGLDHGYNSWIQSMCVDNRYASGNLFFLSTSEGGVISVDTRFKGSVTFNQTLSERKINTVSLHPNGNCLATAGLTGKVLFWDVRKLPSLKSSNDRLPKPIAYQSAGRSINSAYFSPSGTKMVTTTQSNTLDLLESAHTASGVIKPAKSIRHDNQTGRWLSTFMAQWNPNTISSNKEIFVVGSMKKPRTIEVFSSDGELLREIRGEALTAVASRCCFHPNANKFIVLGGNSSGRVTVAR